MHEFYIYILLLFFLINEILLFKTFEMYKKKMMRHNFTQILIGNKQVTYIFEVEIMLEIIMN